MTAQYALIGHPLGHSLSPVIHASLFAATGTDATYVLRDLAALESEAPSLAGLRGYNVTIPYKTQLIAHLDGLDASAARYGAVNCVSHDERGQIGYNTDCIGFLRCVSRFRLDGRVLLLGCGGAGRMMATEAALHGADLTIAVRPHALDAANEFARGLQTTYPDAKVTVLSYADLCGEFDLLLNSTPVGMHPHPDESPVDKACVSRCKAVFDAIYNPERTLLLQYAENCGIPAVGGMEMLVAQAAASHTIWYGAQFSEKALADAARAARAALEGAAT